MCGRVCKGDSSSDVSPPLEHAPTETHPSKEPLPQQLLPGGTTVVVLTLTVEVDPSLGEFRGHPVNPVIPLPDGLGVHRVARGLAEDPDAVDLAAVDDAGTDLGQTSCGTAPVSARGLARSDYGSVERRDESVRGNFVHS